MAALTATVVVAAAHAQTPAKLSSNDQNVIAGRLRLAIAKCWNIDSARLEQPPAPVTIEFHLKRNGALAGRPTIVNQRGIATSIPLAQTAVQAVQNCAPYTGLPAELFANGWARMRMTFGAATSATPAQVTTPAPQAGPRIIKGKAQ